MSLAEFLRAAEPAREAGLVRLEQDAPLCRYTRFGLGGPAAVLAETADPGAFQLLLAAAREAAAPCVVIGGGSNLVVADRGYGGIVLRYRAAGVELSGDSIRADAGLELQRLVDFSIEQGLAGLHTLTRIPGWVGAAVYGNAGAYGHSMHEFVRRVWYFDGAMVREFSNAECEFAYRESIFKRRKDWILLDAEFALPAGDPASLSAEALKIRTIRDEKYPPDMRCAGSIFKNLIVRELPASVGAQIPERVIREGKAPAAWFLEQVGAKGIRRGDIQVAAYHANLIYNDGDGTAADLRAVIADLKTRVGERFQFELEEEVQYVGFD